MMTLVWKELRQNLKWALLALVVLGGAEVFALYQTNGGMAAYQSYNDGITLAKLTFLTVTTFGCAATGFLLGLLQVLPELKRDRWATLIHRPIARGTVFLGKALAGVLLYLLAAGLPFLFCVWLAATPGHFAAPFVPGLVRPGFADTCVGLVYYFAGLLFALHRGGWVAAKALPLFAAFHVSSFVLEINSFHDALWAAFLMMAAIAVAAWGAMRHLESWSARPRLGRIAFFVVGFYGLCGAGDLARFVNNAGSTSDYASLEYELIDDGRPVKLRYLKGTIVSVQDLEGHEMKEPNYQPDRVRSHFHYMNSCSSFIGDSHGWNSGERTERYRESYNYLWAGTPYTFPRLEQWFYLMKERYVIGMLPDQKVQMALLDGRGFQPLSATPVPFAPHVQMSYAGQDSYVIWDSQSVRLANLSRRQMTNLELPVPGPVYGVTTIWARNGNGAIYAQAVAGATAVAIYDDRSRKFTATLPYHQAMDHWGNVRVGINGAGDRYYVQYDPSMWIAYRVRKTMPSYLEELNAQGEVLHAYTLPPLPDLPRPVSWMNYITQRVQSPAFFFGTLLYQKAGAALGNTRLRDALADRLGEDWPETKRIATWIILLSGLCAGIALWWARQAQFPWRRAGAWAAVALVFNVAGLLLLRLVADWPRQVPCASCRRARPIAEEYCPHCASKWPEVPPSGTEIFDHPEMPMGKPVAPI